MRDPGRGKPRCDPFTDGIVTAGKSYLDVRQALDDLGIDEVWALVVHNGTLDEEALRQPVVVGFIAGRTAPPGRRMGHAGAVISGGNDTAEYKVEFMRSVGIHVADSPAALGEEMLKAMKG